MSGQPPARYLLLLDTLVDELIAAAIDAGELAVRPRPPAVGPVSRRGGAPGHHAALRDLGFRLDLHDGWFGGRAPTAQRPRVGAGVRGHTTCGRSAASPRPPTLRDLPGSVTVAAHEHLRRTAPDLTLVQMSAPPGRAAARAERSSCDAVGPELGRGRAGPAELGGPGGRSGRRVGLSRRSADVDDPEGLRRSDAGPGALLRGPAPDALLELLGLARSGWRARAAPRS